MNKTVIICAPLRHCRAASHIDSATMNSSTYCMTYHVEHYAYCVLRTAYYACALLPLSTDQD